MIGWEFPPKNSGGLGVACQGIVESLVDAGEEVTLVLPKIMKPDSVTDYFSTPKGNRYRVVFISSKLTPYASVPGNDYQGNLVNDVYTYGNMVETALLDSDFHIIHIHDWLTVPAGIALKERFNIPLVMHIHSSEYDRTGGGSENKAVMEIEKKGLEKADKVIAVSGYTGNLIKERYGIRKDKISVVHNGIQSVGGKGEYEEFLGKAPMILFVGRLTIQKGPEFFVRLAERVLKREPEAVFVMVGDGDMYRSLLEYSAFSQLSGSVLFAGFLRGKAKESMFKRADVFVMPSVSEPFGLVALEAARYGVPVIISKTSGVAEVLPSAVTVDFWDTDLMTDAIVDLLEKRDSNVLGEKLKREVEQLTWVNAVEKIRQIYKELSPQ